MRGLGTCLILLFACHAEQLPVRYYTTADGLAHNHVNRIRQDSRGFLWIGTDEGLTRFDGYRLTSFTIRDGLPHSWINDVIESRDGTLWIASDGGVSQLNSRRTSAAEPTFVTYLPDQHPDARRVNALAEDASGAIWCATYNGLYRLDRAHGHISFKRVDIGLTGAQYEVNLVNSVAADPRGALWIGARSGLYHRLADGRVERYTTRQGLPDNFTGSLLRDQDDRWWVATRMGGFCLLAAHPGPGRRVVEHCYSAADGLPHNDVRSLLQTWDGKMWIGTILGLSEFTPQAAHGIVFRNYTVANGLSDTQINSLSEDRDGNLWIGTRRGGLMKMARDGFLSYGQADGLQPGTTHHEIFETISGDICVLTGTGSGGLVQRLNGQKFVATKINLPFPASAGNIFIEHGFQDGAGEWWFGTRHGLVHFPRTVRPEGLAHARPNVYARTDGLLSEDIDYVYKDSRGMVWIATTHAPLQLRQWDPVARRLRLYASDEPELRPPNAGPVAACALDSSNHLWLGFRNGIMRCRAGQLERFFDAPVAIQGQVNALYLDRLGRLWIASAQGGLYRWDKPDSAQPHLARYTTDNGLSSNEILCLTEDQWGRIYAGTNRGVDRLEPVMGSIKHFSSSDGLSRGAVSLAYRDHHGALWFATDEGISRLMPAPDSVPLPPPVLITGLRQMGIPLPISALGERRVRGLELAPNRNQLQIDFVGLDFRPGTVLRYQYKLDRADRTWSAPTSERTVNYASIAPGSYRFLVRAINSDGISSPEPAAVMFIVLAPVWRQWWFLALCGTAAALAIYAVHRLRLQQLLAVERIRTGIATDLHDDVGASLSRIALLSEVARMDAARGGGVQESLSRIADISREVIDAMSEIVWATNPQRDRLSDLANRMRAFAEDMLVPRDIKFVLQAPALSEDSKIGPKLRRQLFLIFKECIHNIERHSGCTEALADLRVQKQELTLRISDNGVGLHTSSNDPRVCGGQGLASIQARAASLQGRIEVTSEAGKGLALVIHAPLGPGFLTRSRMARLLAGKS
ncbi:MAG: hypothetical protein JO185_04710 [Acidobacteriaceae bacterium]|nr:hypothetical protein [Acidobacteriaceae bacterium]